jgi:hypothetical protein
MEGQSLPFTSFALHNFYLIQSEGIFLSGLRKMHLNSFLRFGWGFVPRSRTKKISQYLNKLAPPPHPQKNLLGMLVFFFLHFCRKCMLETASVPSVLWTTGDLRRRIIYFVLQFWFLYLLQDQSNVFSVGATRRICITVTYETRKLRDACKFMSDVFCPRNLRKNSITCAGQT